MAGKIRVGTSSWADPGFVKEWYPPKMTARERLPWYAERFEYVELNSSFYAVPDRTTVHKWVEDTPDGFVFDYKLHKALSRHSAELNSLPPDMRDGVETTSRGRVRLTGEDYHRVATAICEPYVRAYAPKAEVAAYLSVEPGVIAEIEPEVMNCWDYADEELMSPTG